MTKEVYIYISLFVVMLGYLFYMDYQGKTIARPTGEIISAEEKEKMLNARDYLLHLGKSVPHVSPIDLKNPVEGMIVYREELSPLANMGLVTFGEGQWDGETYIPSLHELLLPFAIYSNGGWQEISLGDIEEMTNDTGR